MNLFHSIKFILPLAFFLVFSGCQFSAVERPDTDTTLPLETSPTPVETPLIQSFEIQPAEVLLGEPAILSWNVTGVSKIEITPEVGAVDNQGELTLSPAERTVYQITAVNSAGSTSKTAVINVNRNAKAKPIALTIEEMESQGFDFIINSEPSQIGTVSTYYIKFAIGLTESPFIDNTVYIFRNITQAENIFSLEKYNARMFVAGAITIGTQGYYTVVKTALPPEQPTTSIIFQKNNVYVKMSSNLEFPQIEKYARLCDARIK